MRNESQEKQPCWFVLYNKANGPTQQRAVDAIENNGLSTQLTFAPQQAMYFFLHSLKIAYETNKAGIHANSLAQMRCCIEALSIVELGMCNHSDREAILTKWVNGNATPGALRKWLSTNLWPGYGSGIWDESWEDFMGNLARAVQPYAHYTSQLAQWQTKLHFAESSRQKAYIEIGPQVYDPQKATRVTLYHGILTYALGRIWCANSKSADLEFVALNNRLGTALGKSRYLDGKKTDWDRIFWAMLWDGKDGSPILE